MADRFSDTWWLPVLLLSTCWALAISVLTASAASINLAAAEMTSDANLHTLPLALTSLAQGLYNFVLPTEIERMGRWRSYLLGAALGASGGLCCAGGCELRSLLLLCAGAALVGVGMAHAQNFRFGVQLCVEKSKEPVAISWVLAGGVVGAVCGPEYSKHAKSMLPTPFSGVFLVSAGCFVLLLALLLAGAPLLHGLSPRPQPVVVASAAGAKPDAGAASEAPPRRSLLVIFSQPRCWASTFIATASYAIMVFYMAVVALQMKREGFSFSDSALAVQLHMVAMFAPSLVTGHAFKAFGGVALELSGTLLLTSGFGLAYASGSLAGFGGSQALIGLGWNLCFVAATAGFAQALRPAERATAQAANDAAVFLTSGACMVAAAPSLTRLGWQRMQLVGFATSGLMLLVLALSEALAARQAAAMAAAGAAADDGTPPKQEAHAPPARVGAPAEVDGQDGV